MKKKKRVVHFYSLEEKAEALRQLALNKGDLSKTAKDLGISSSNLYSWKEKSFAKQASETFQKEDLEKLIRSAWKNILLLSKPSFIKKISARALEEGRLKEILNLLAIFGQMPIFGRKENDSRILIDIQDQVKRNTDELHKLRMLFQKTLKSKN